MEGPILNQPSVSIIVAVYKSEQFLPKLLHSFEVQTHKNLQIILVDDGSPDDSGRICDEYATRDPRAIVIHKPNGGTCSARNAGLGVATGDYLMIVDGDDWLEPDCVEYLVDLAESTGSDMSYSVNLFTTRDREQIVEDVRETWSAERATSAIIYPFMRLGPWNKLYKRSVVVDNNISFSVPWFGEGLYFATEVAQHSNHVGVGRRKVYNYRLNNMGSGLTNYNVQNGKNALGNIKFIKENLTLDTPMVRHACDWHIWRNYEFLLTQIIGADEMDSEGELVKECATYVRKNWLSVFKNSEVGHSEKIKIACCGMAPVLYAKLIIDRNRKGLEADKGKFMDVEE